MQTSRILPWLALSVGLTAAPLSAQGVERELSPSGEWIVADQPAPGTPEAALAEARRALAEGRYAHAERLAERWIENHPEHELLPEAYLVRADSRYLRSDFYKSLYDYETIAREYPGSEAFAVALEREYDIAVRFAQGMRRKLWGVRWMLAYAEAEELLIRVQERAPGSRLAQKAGRALADYYYGRRKMRLAVTAYDLYIRNHPRAEDQPEAIERVIYANLATFKGPRFDPSGLYDAREWLDVLETRHPAKAESIGADALRHRIDESDARRMFTDAEWYLKREDPVAARYVLVRLLKRYPDTVAAREAYELMVERGWMEAEPLLENNAPPSEGEAADGTDEPSADAEDTGPMESSETAGGAAEETGTSDDEPLDEEQP